MKTALGILLVIVGVFLGLYAGIWWAFIGGIIRLINDVKAPVTIPTDIALHLARVVFAGLIGWASAIILMVPGVALIND